MADLSKKSPAEMANRAGTAPTPGPTDILIERESQIATRYRGPIPKPEALMLYERVLPGSAERILRMAEVEAEAAITLRHKALTETVNDGRAYRLENRRGQQFGFASVVVLAALGATIALFGKGDYATVIGAVVGSAGLASVIIAYRNREPEVDVGEAVKKIVGFSGSQEPPK